MSFFHFSEDYVSELPITKFRNYLKQCFNIASLQFGGEFEFQTEKDKQTDLDNEVEELIREGELNG